MFSDRVTAMQNFGIRFYTDRPYEEVEGWLHRHCRSGWNAKLTDVDWDDGGTLWKRMNVQFADAGDRRTFVSGFFGR